MLDFKRGCSILSQWFLWSSVKIKQNILAPEQSCSGGSPTERSIADCVCIPHCIQTSHTGDRWCQLGPSSGTWVAAFCRGARESIVHD